MDPKDALSVLGSSRVVWIDDQFARGRPEQVADLIFKHLDIARKCNLPDLADLFEDLETGADPNALSDLTQRILDMGTERTAEIKAELFKHELEGHEFATNDLTDDQIKAVKEQLAIADGDCWSFDYAEAEMKKLCVAGDSTISYIIDLNDAHGPNENQRGMELVSALWQMGSKATTFLLTHAADEGSETRKEIELREKLPEGLSGAHSIPLCVIAKERLEGDPVNTSVAEGLRVAIKRAGLRRNIQAVIAKASAHVGVAFGSAVDAILQVPPEQLDYYVIKRAYMEGESELHVVERALTATVSESLRRLFATDPETRSAAEQLRKLRDVPLAAIQSGEPHIELQQFRTKEVWDDGSLINGSFSPLACGDVFETQGEGGSQRFVLLVQPCDVAIRSKGDRDAEWGFLVLLRQANGEGNSKQSVLPFKLDKKEWLCDFRKVTSASLCILDLATLRPDGFVRYDKDQNVAPALLPGQQAMAKKLFRILKSALGSRQKASLPSGWRDERCQLTLSSRGPFKGIAHGNYVAQKASSGRVQIVEHFDWRLTRIGRVRMPYATSLLNDFLAVMSREAFALDYLKDEVKKPSETVAPEAAAVAASQ